MNLLIASPATIRGGAEEYLLNIGRAAASHKHNVTAVFPLTDKTTSLRDDIHKAGVTYINYSIEPLEDARRNKPWNLFRDYLRSIRFLLRTKPQSVLAIAVLPNGCIPIELACLTLRIRVSVVYQLVPSAYNYSHITRFLKKILFRLNGKQWIFVSANNRDLFCRNLGLKSGPLNVIYNGVDVEFNGHAQRTNKRFIRQKLGLPEDDNIILTVGKICHRKGYDLVVDAVPRILILFPNTSFVFVGHGDDNWAYSLCNEKDQQDRIILTGRRDDVRDFYLAADLFLFPSRDEGHSFALSEAISYELPVVSSNASGIPEMLSHEEHALLFESGNAADLSQKLLIALSDPKQMKIYAQAALKRLETFSAARMCKKTMAFLLPN